MTWFLSLSIMLMGKGESKSKKGGHGSASKDEVDPILATALARPDTLSRVGAVGNAGPSAKQTKNH